MKERPQSKKYNKLGNGLIDLPDCEYVTETYTDDLNRLVQTIMFNYNDDRERNLYRETVYPTFKLLKRCYFKKNGKLIFLEDHKHGTDS